MAKIVRWMVIIIVLLAPWVSLALGQEPAAPTLDAARKQAVIDEISTLLNKNYIFAETAKKMEEAMKVRERRLREARRNNFGFRKVERLPGNIGYVDFRSFASPDQAGATAVAAMNFLAYCDAIIVDLRQNGGGDPAQIQLISSYVFDEPVHLNDLYARAINPVSKTNWEGTGVAPDIACPAAEAFDRIPGLAVEDWLT